MRLPAPRGAVSAALAEALLAAPHDLPPELAGQFDDKALHGDALHDEDLQLSLLICYELHYRGFEGVDDAWEWQPSVLALRAVAERRFEETLRQLVGTPGPLPPGEVPGAVAALVAQAGDGPSLAGYLRRHADLEQFREFLIHRSIYQLKEADPHTWGIPRLDGRAKAALIEIQLDEYGGGELARMHAELFRTTMSLLGLDAGYGAYVDAVPAVSLAGGNLISMFGLHRRLRGALLGHLAAFEMTSSLPNRMIGDGLRRLGGDLDATRFFDEHVEADAVHEQIAAVDMCGGYASSAPEDAGNVLFGASCCLALDRRAASHILSDWEAGRSSLRPQTAATS
jgi:hypothetical protein